MLILLDILNISIVQIILVSCIGALLGEMKKEIDDDEAVILSKFLISWLSSGFVGVMVGLLLQGTVGKDNNYIVLGGAGTASFAGQQKSINIATKLLLLVTSDEKATNKKKKK